CHLPTIQQNAPACLLNAKEQWRAWLQCSIDQPIARPNRLPGLTQRAGRLVVQGTEQKQELAAQVIQAAGGHFDGWRTLSPLSLQQAKVQPVEEMSPANVGDQLVVVTHPLAD